MSSLTAAAMALSGIAGGWQRSVGLDVMRVMRFVLPYSKASSPATSTPVGPAELLVIYSQFNGGMLDV